MIKIQSIKLKQLLFLLLALLSFPLFAADEFPQRPDPPRLVNDFARLLTDQQREALENKLSHYARSSSTQIAIVVVEDLMGYDKADYSFRLAEKWGIGQKGKNNGILILLKPKNANSRGEVFVAVGYGLEGVVPDITARQTIIQNEMIPAFKVNDYYTGLDRAADVLIALTSGEFTAEQYDNPGGKSPIAGIVVILVVLFFIFFSMLSRSKRFQTMSTSTTPTSLLGTLMMMDMMRGRHTGTFNDFSGGRGGFGGFGGGSSGGFGGFGGGSFGGGGGGGSW